MAYRILMVEDDPIIALSISKALTLSGHVVKHLSSSKDAVKELEEKKWDVLLLDIKLPDGVGFDVCKVAHLYHPLMPILMLTANTDEDSVVRSLNMGAVDYMRKPVGSKEILARIQRALGGTEILHYGPLVLHLTKRELIIKGQPVRIPRREFEILSVLIRKAEQVVSRDEILQRTKSAEDTMERSIDSHLSRLRKRLSGAGAELSVESVYGAGYRLKKAA